MALFLLIARLLLAAVLGVAGIAKLADLTGSRQAMLGFGVPARLAAPLGVLLPLAEIATALLLLITPLAWWGALGALLLLAIFVVGISVNLARGQTPNCHCFGQLHSEPIGWPTLARNALLAALALWIVAQGPTRVAAGMGNVAATPALTWFALGIALVAVALVAIEGWFLLNLLQQNGRLMLRIEALEAQSSHQPVAPVAANSVKGLAVGTPAPSFSLAGLFGETLTLNSLLATQKPLLLLFIDPNCAPCHTLLPDVARWQNEHAPQLTVVPISRGKAEANNGLANYGNQGLQHLLLQKEFEVAEAYQVAVTPSALVVRADGKIGSPLAAGPEEIRTLLRNTVSPTPLPSVIPITGNIMQGVKANGDCGCGKNGASSNGRHLEPSLSLPQRLQRGDATPTFRLPTLDGNLVEFEEFGGSPTLLLFWNPGCGYCRQMLNNLKAWEANPPVDAPKLLLISTGSVEANQALALQSPILLDTDFATARNFGVRGTPSAILIDGEGRIASDVAAGRDAVLALARGEENLALTAAR